MGCFIIEGGNRLDGELTVQGSKNGALPLFAASLLVGGETVLKNCPKLTDITAAGDILTYLGCRVTADNGTICILSDGASRCDVSDSLMREMRSSIVFLGAMLARFGRAELCAPGGCEIGLRPIDLHLEAIKALGARVEEQGGRLVCTCPNGLSGARISLSFPSVGATENILLAASTARGATLIVNAAREPEIVELAEYLNACGAKISGAGESIIQIEGVKSLHGAEHTVWQDRIAASTYLSAAAITGGKVFLRSFPMELIMPVLESYERMGCKTVQLNDGLMLTAPERLNKFGLIRTMPYPGFPTDSQAAFASMASVARGTSMIVENIFESRFKYIAELTKMGASIRTEGRVAIIEGVRRLHGANVVSPDLRGGSALVVAALAAQGVTRVEEIRHIDRGYEDTQLILSRLGASIVREE